MMMTVRTKGIGGIAALTTFLASPLIRAAPDDLLPPPDEPSVFWETWSPKLLDWQLPVTVAVFCLAIVMMLHWLKSRSAARRWRGEHAGWLSLWALPCLVGLALYTALLLGTIVWGHLASPVFANYLANQFVTERKLFWLFGWLITVSPAIAILFIPARRSALSR